VRRVIIFDRFLLTYEHSGLILFTPCLFLTCSPPHIAYSEAFHDLRSSLSTIDFWRNSVSKSTIRAGFRFDSISFR
jgi:hypothetical protein